MGFKQDKKTVRFPTKWAVIALSLFLGASLTGCTQNSRYQESIVSAADSAQHTFTLPREEDAGAPIPLWETVLIICPYDDTNLVPEPFAKNVKNLDTVSTEDVQWLLFSEQNNVSRIAVERSAIDFCQGQSHPKEYESNQAWNAVKHDGAWVMTPTTA